MAEAEIYSLRATVVMTDGTSYQVMAIHPDLIRYEDMARQRGWGGPDTAPMRWSGYVCWAALKRTGEIGEDYDSWSARIGNVAAADGAKAGQLDQPVDPTRPEAG